jgi:hypothetical protein
VSEAFTRLASHRIDGAKRCTSLVAGFAFLGVSSLALGRVAAPAPEQRVADISGQVSAFVGFRATASSNRRRRSTRAGWLVGIREANYGHANDEANTEHVHKSRPAP